MGLKIKICICQNIENQSDTGAENQSEKQKYSDKFLPKHNFLNFLQHRNHALKRYKMKYHVALFDIGWWYSVFRGQVFFPTLGEVETKPEKMTVFELL